MKKLILSLTVASIGLLSGCSAQHMVRQYGGTDTIDLPAGKKLVQANWEGEHLWYLLRSAKTGEKPEVLEFKESRSYGGRSGTVIFREH